MCVNTFRTSKEVMEMANKKTAPKEQKPAAPKPADSAPAAPAEKKA